MNANVLDPDSTQTTKVVVGLLQKANLLGKGQDVYMDNYYSSPDLFWELHCEKVFACGTCQPNCQNLPKAVIKAKLKKKGHCCLWAEWTIVMFEMAWKKRCYNADNKGGEEWYHI